MRREFSANVSHELKTPLMAISGYAEIISRNMVKKEDIPEFAGRIYKEATRMTTLIEDIIKLSRLDEQSDMMPFESVNLNQITSEIVDTLQVVARKRHMTIYVDGEMPNIYGVRQVVYDMLYNLCDNAVKYNRDGGYVHILIEPSVKEGYAVKWSVKDTGIGIQEDKLEVIFENFEQLEKIAQENGWGYDNGLAIVKHGAKLHDALLEIESHVGEGTCISVEFPMDKAAAI